MEVLSTINAKWGLDYGESRIILVAFAIAQLVVCPELLPRGDATEPTDVSSIPGHGIKRRRWGKIQVEPSKGSEHVNKRSVRKVKKVQSDVPTADSTENNFGKQTCTNFLSQWVQGWGRSEWMASCSLRDRRWEKLFWQIWQLQGWKTNQNQKLFLTLTGVV